MIAEKAEENIKTRNTGKKKPAKVKVFKKKKKSNQPEITYVEKLREKYSQVRK